MVLHRRAASQCRTLHCTLELVLDQSLSSPTRQPRNFHPHRRSQTERNDHHHDHHHHRLEEANEINKFQAPAQDLRPKANTFFASTFLPPRQFAARRRKIERQKRMSKSSIYPIINQPSPHCASRGPIS